MMRGNDQDNPESRRGRGREEREREQEGSRMVKQAVNPFSLSSFAHTRQGQSTLNKREQASLTHLAKKI